MSIRLCFCHPRMLVSGDLVTLTLVFWVTVQKSIIPNKELLKFLKLFISVSF